MREIEFRAKTAMVIGFMVIRYIIFLLTRRINYEIFNKYIISFSIVRNDSFDCAM